MHDAAGSGVGLIALGMGECFGGRLSHPTGFERIVRQVSFQDNSVILSSQILPVACLRPGNDELPHAVHGHAFTDVAKTKAAVALWILAYQSQSVEDGTPAVELNYVTLLHAVLLLKASLKFRNAFTLYHHGTLLKSLVLATGINSHGTVFSFA